jgi:hypothetical protein
MVPLQALAAVLLLAFPTDAQEPRQPPVAPSASSAAGSLKPSADTTPLQHDDPRGAVDALLGSRDGAVSPERWRKLGPRAAPILEGIAADGLALPTRRARALEGVVALRSPHAAALVVKLAQSEAEPFVVRLAAVRGAGRVLRPARQLPALLPALEKASDPHLRAAAAEVLSHQPAGCAAVRAQALRETAETRGAFEASIGRCASN